MEAVIAEISPSLLRNIPDLAAWITGLILAVIMLRRGGARAEKLLVAGCSLMLAETITRPLLQVFILQWIDERDISGMSAAKAMSLISIPAAVLSLAGLVCLVWAFWIKFRAKKLETA